MGNFIFAVEAVGDHGNDRHVALGGKLEPGKVDGAGQVLIDRLREVGASVVSATLTHWPDSTPIVDDILNGKRIVRDFSTPWVDEPLLQFFMYWHLPPELQETSKAFCRFAYNLVATTPRNPERTVALRKLLEAKDCAVRALLMKGTP